MIAAQPNRKRASAHSDSLALLRLLLETPPAGTVDRSPIATVHQRAAQAPRAGDDLDFLRGLLEAGPALSQGRMRPVTLRSTEAHRQLVLLDTRPVSSFDTLLLRAQQLMLVGALLAAGYWFVDGPLRDWLHAAYKPSAAIAVERPRLITAAPAPAALLPSTAPAPVEPTPGGPEETQPPLAEAFLVPRQRMLLESQISSPTPQPTITPQPTKQILPTPSEPTRLLIPSIGVDSPVVEVFPVDDTWQVAEYAAGYMHGTARAGEAGNMAIAGHLGLRGAVFLNLSALQPGADVFVDAIGWRYHYRMRDSQVVWPNQIEVLYPEETTTLTLITCTNWDTQRLVVKADLLGWEQVPT